MPAKKSHHPGKVSAFSWPTITIIPITYTVTPPTHTVIPAKAGISLCWHSIERINHYRAPFDQVTNHLIGFPFR